MGSADAFDIIQLSLMAKVRLDLIVNFNCDDPLPDNFWPHTSVVVQDSLLAPAIVDHSVFCLFAAT